jgi:hypothetical protein
VLELKRSLSFPAVVILLGAFLVLVGVYVSLAYTNEAPHAKPNRQTEPPSLSRLVPSSPAPQKSDMEMAVEQYMTRKAGEEAQRQAAAQAAAQGQEASGKRFSSAAARQRASGGESSAGGASSASAGYSKQDEANAILAGLIAQYPLLQGSVVYIQETPNGWEGAAYYKSGVILVNPNHTYSLYEIIYHEAMHILDWREDGKIDYNDYR